MKRIVCLLLLFVLLCGCSADSAPVQETYFSMDTVMDLKVWGSDAREGIAQIEALLDRLASDWSATEEDSIISRMNRGEDVALSGEEADLLAQVEALSQRTGGAFHPKLRSLSLAWGFYNGENRNPGFVIPSDSEIAAAMAEQQWDLGGALKGYAGQQCANLLAQLEVDRAMLTLGGNVQTYGSKPGGAPWQIGIQDPDGEGYLGILSVTGTISVVTSGDYQRYFEKDGVTYHHILDPQTGRPADSGLRSVTVLCRDGLTADALSTALFVMGLEKAAQFWRESSDFEAVLVLASGEIYATEGANLSGCQFEVIHREN